MGGRKKASKKPPGKKLVRKKTATKVQSPRKKTAIKVQPEAVKLQLTAWVMFENHTFTHVEGTIETIPQKIRTIAETDPGMFAGWGRLTLKGISSDDLCIVDGLLQVDRLDETFEMNNFVRLVNGALTKVDAKIDAAQATLESAHDLKEKFELLRTKIKTFAEELGSL